MWGTGRIITVSEGNCFRSPSWGNWRGCDHYWFFGESEERQGLTDRSSGKEIKYTRIGAKRELLLVAKPRSLRNRKKPAIVTRGSEESTLVELLGR